MCEIQMINRFKTEIDEIDREEFIRMMTNGSRGNRDAFGFFNRMNTYKLGKSFENKAENMKVRNIIDDMKGNFLVGHNRLSTKGNSKDNKNNHPFESKHWKVVHNGVLDNDIELKTKYNFRYKEKVDSAIIPTLLEHYTNEGMSELEAVKSTAEEITGWYSIVCYYKPTDTIYYFKNSQTYFFMALIEDDRGKVLVSSTNKETIEECYTKYDMIFSKPNYQRKTIIEPAEAIIYRIDVNEIRELDTFKENISSNYWCGSKDYGGGRGYDVDDVNDFDKSEWESGNNRSCRGDWEHDFPNYNSEIGDAQQELLELGKVNDLSSIQTDYVRGCIKVKAHDNKLFYDIANSYPSAELEDGWVIVNFEDFLTDGFDFDEI